jgi:hypothetical protein
MVNVAFSGARGHACSEETKGDARSGTREPVTVILWRNFKNDPCSDANVCLWRISPSRGRVLLRQLCVLSESLRLLRYDLAVNSR